MKFLAFKFVTLLLYLISTSLSYSIEQPNIKNIVILKDYKSYENVIFKDSNNKEINLENFKDKLILINFWAIWCVPCREEMPSLDLLQSQNKLNNLKIFPINVGNDELIKSKNFFKELNINNLDIYFDSDLSLTKKFSLRGIPTTILINKKGQEFARIIGYIDFNDKKFVNWLKNFN